jgi:transcriptional regulator with XRE-family HTH domain
MSSIKFTFCEHVFNKLTLSDMIVLRGSNMSLGKQIKSLRERKKLSQRKLAELLNMAPSTLAMYEVDKREPDFGTLEKIADFFGVSTDYLLGRLSDPSTICVSEEASQYTAKTPDIDYIYQAKTLADAIIRIEKMRREFNLSKEWMYEMWDKAIEVYGQPEGGELAAHGPSYPGSGALDGGDEPR